ncbi:DnrP protein [Alkalimarinus alittae]|uniref:DnrP protein n=1 Tax=Alkalimarinus alittae TaxID=2961619 RepID=A0ABY6N6B6_9ALTE|nr:DnrP protein [Alkalimarinus alittae]UZE97656.1 DnrP protein [Alkalimarinus alittae]
MSERCCPNCQAPLEAPIAKGSAPICQRCGMAISPARDGYIAGLRMNFKTAVILLTVFCVVMMFWLPR